MFICDELGWERTASSLLTQDDISAIFWLNFVYSGRKWRHLVHLYLCQWLTPQSHRELKLKTSDGEKWATDRVNGITFIQKREEGKKNRILSLKKNSNCLQQKHIWNSITSVPICSNINVSLPIFPLSSVQSTMLFSMPNVTVLVPHFAFWAGIHRQCHRFSHIIKLTHSQPKPTLSCHHSLPQTRLLFQNDKISTINCISSLFNEVHYVFRLLLLLNMNDKFHHEKEMLHCCNDVYNLAKKADCFQSHIP